MNNYQGTATNVADQTQEGPSFLPTLSTNLKVRTSQQAEMITEIESRLNAIMLIPHTKNDSTSQTPGPVSNPDFASEMLFHQSYIEENNNRLHSILLHLRTIV